MECQTSENMFESSGQSSEFSEEVLRQGSRPMKPKGLTISIGDEGGSGAMGMKHAQTSRASKAQAIYFTDEFEQDEDEEEDGPAQRPKRKINRELTQSTIWNSMSVAEQRKKKQEDARKKIQEDYNKKRDPVKEFFQLTC